jgi:hypothetical protein
VLCSGVISDHIDAELPSDERAASWALSERRCDFLYRRYLLLDANPARYGYDFRPNPR